MIQNKLFKNCPNPNSQSCMRCENYTKCIAKKNMILEQRERIRFQREQEEKRIKRKLKVITFLVIALIWVMTQIVLAEVQKPEEDTLDEDYTATATINESTPISSTVMATTVGTITNPKNTEIEDVVATKVVVSTLIKTETPVQTKPVAKLSAKSPSETYYYDISYEDKVLIAKVVYEEARGESFEGQVAVAAVVLNRYFKGDGMGFDRDSIYSIVTQKNQFASIKNTTVEKLEKCPSCMEAVEAACKGWDPTMEVFEDGAFFFFNPNGLSKSAARNREGIEVMIIGNHCFHESFEKML